MRTFIDANGRDWQAALLETSYGNVVLIFSPLQENIIRKWVMPTPNMVAADQYLTGLNDTELLALLAESEPWDPSTAGS